MTATELAFKIWLAWMVLCGATGLVTITIVDLGGSNTKGLAFKINGYAIAGFAWGIGGLLIFVAIREILK